jgi:uncharacterized protein YbjT (DUF2867 family)
MKPTILIAGATGATGSAATKFLLKKGFPVCALVHTDGEQAQRLKAQGAEMVVGDYLDFRSMRRAFNDVQRAYFVYTKARLVTIANTIGKRTKLIWQCATLHPISAADPIIENDFLL